MAASTRDRIYDAICQEPGLSKTSLCGAVGLGWGTVSHHLRVLELNDLIHVHASGRMMLAFPRTIPRRQLQALAALRHGCGSEVARALESRPGLSLGELATQLGESRKVIRRHLTTLGDAHLVRRTESGHPRYWPTGRLATFKALVGIGPELANGTLTT